MTNSENIFLLGILSALEDLYYSDKPTKVEITKEVMPFISGNIRLLTPISTERQAFETDFMKIWKKEFSFDESKLGKKGEETEEQLKYQKEANEAWAAFRNNKKNVKAIEEWLEKDNTVSLVQVESFDGCMIPSSTLDILEKYLLKK